MREDKRKKTHGLRAVQGSQATEISIINFYVRRPPRLTMNQPTL